MMLPSNLLVQGPVQLRTVLRESAMPSFVETVPTLPLPRVDVAIAVQRIITFGQVMSVSQLACNANSVNSEESTTYTVTLSGAAPASGT